MDTSRTLEIAALDGSWVQVVEVARQTVNHLTVKSPAPPPRGITVRCRRPTPLGEAAFVEVVAVNAELVALRPRSEADKQLLLATAEPTPRRWGNPARLSIAGEIEAPTARLTSAAAPAPKVQICWDPTG